MANMKPVPSARDFDLAKDTLRDLNFFLHRRAADDGVSQIRVHHPDGAHSIACGLDTEIDVQIHGHVGYYVAGMNQHASVTVHGNAGPGVHVFVRTAPSGAEYFSWRIEILPAGAPPTGLELATGLQLNTVTPEQAAAELREL